jgi:hypothetical protein
VSECELPAAVGGRPDAVDRVARSSWWMLPGAPRVFTWWLYLQVVVWSARHWARQCGLLVLLFVCLWKRGAQELANFTEQGPWGVNSRSVTQEIRVRVFRSGQKNPPLAPLMSQMDVVHSVYVWSVLILFCHIILRINSRTRCSKDFIWEVLGFNLVRNTSYPDSDCTWFSSIPPFKRLDNTLNKPSRLPSKSFPIHHYSRIILPSDITWPWYWKRR